MKTIHKYEIKIQYKQRVEITGFLDYLKVDEQDGKLYLFVLVNTDLFYTITSDVYIVGTGNRIKRDEQSETMINKGTHFDSVSMSNGVMWHLFIPSILHKKKVREQKKKENMKIDKYLKWEPNSTNEIHIEERDFTITLTKKDVEIECSWDNGYDGRGTETMSMTLEQLENLIKELKNS
jgi:hypothetical protein